MSVATMFQILVNADIYAPEPMGLASVMVCAGKIVDIKKMPETFSEGVLKELKAEVVDCQGRKVVPGFVDGHVHITGGGGEGGYKSACPPLPLTEMTLNGVTTVVGVLGTDDCTRTTANLVMRAKALEEEGITAFTYTGYRIFLLPGTVLRAVTSLSCVLNLRRIPCPAHYPHWVSERGHRAQ
eukprot:2786843-Rhodomonas_salina.1